MDDRLRDIVRNMPPSAHSTIVAKMFSSSLMSPYAVIMSAAFKQLESADMTSEQECELYLKLCKGEGGSGNHQLDVCAMIIGCGMELFMAQAKLFGLDEILNISLEKCMDSTVIKQLLDEIMKGERDD